ncbi:MAG: glycoside hydrolase family 130 protein [Anaerolineae bacterium]|nr:glycoside hydrolase family 130 protein [Anaerolineae bacterium]
MAIKIIGNPLPNIPWEDKPAGTRSVVWRSARNPIIPRDLLPTSNSIFNSAVVPYKGAFTGVFRCDDTSRQMQLHVGHSQDGVTWELNPERIHFACNDADCDCAEVNCWVYGYDPRVVWIEDRYYVSWCNWFHGATIGMAYTHDFETFYQLENAYLPFNRNGVLFPRKIKGKYAMVSRPSDNGHTPFGDIFYSESPDMRYWGNHRYVFGTVGGWQSTKVGAGPIPIETSEGWLMIYHGVLTSCNGFVYSAGVALLDLDQPWKVIARSRHYLISPQKIYECVGDTPNVVFPCAALCDADTGRLAIYYGGADTVVALAFGYVEELIDFAKSDSLV